MNEFKSNQINLFINQNRHVTKKQHKTTCEYAGQMAYAGFKNPLRPIRVASKI